MTKRFAIIPARKGSKRLKNKNRLLFYGVPIFVHSVEVARASGLFDNIFVSTDDPKIPNIVINRTCVY